MQVSRHQATSKRKHDHICDHTHGAPDGEVAGAAHPQPLMCRELEEVVECAVTQPPPRVQRTPACVRAPHATQWSDEG